MLKTQEKKLLSIIVLSDLNIIIFRKKIFIDYSLYQKNIWALRQPAKQLLSLPYSRQSPLTLLDVVLTDFEYAILS